MSELPAPAGELPVFYSGDWSEHVRRWLDIEEAVGEARWHMAAIAASLTAQWGERGEVMAAFASEVGCSARRVYEYAYTYNAWYYRDRAQTLSLKHHTLAVRSDDPEGWIGKAEGEGMSARDLESAIAVEREKGGEVVEMENCPRCGGAGKIPKGEEL